MTKPNVERYGLTLDEWNALSPKEKRSVYRRYYRKAHPDKVREYKRRNRMKHRDERNAWNREYNRQRRQDPDFYAAHLAQVKAYRKENLEKVRAQDRSYWPKKAAKRKARTNPQFIMTRVDRAVSRILPRHIREDLIAAMVLDVLEGRLLLDQIEEKARTYLTRYNREYETWSTVSLDMPVGDQTLGYALGVN